MVAEGSEPETLHPKTEWHRQHLELLIVENMWVF